MPPSYFALYLLYHGKSRPPKPSVGLTDNELMLILGLLVGYSITSSQSVSLRPHIIQMPYTGNNTIKYSLLTQVNTPNGLIRTCVQLPLLGSLFLSSAYNKLSKEIGHWPCRG